MMNQRTDKHRGFTLIEMLATIAVGSMMAGVAVSVLYMLLGIERDGRQELRYRTTVDRLTRQFRDDVHAALDFRQEMHEHQAGDKTVQQPAWLFDLGQGRSVEYVLAKESLARTERAGAAAIASEEYALSPDCVVTIEAEGLGHQRLVRLRIVPDDAPGGEPRIEETQIEAVLGRDHRMLRPENTK